MQRTRDISCAEKIYATLRECREQTGVKKSRGVRMQGYLLKKSEKNKKWKNMYFMLQNEHGEDRLYFYDNPKRTKPRGLIDLSCSYLYQVCTWTQFQFYLFIYLFIYYANCASVCADQVVGRVYTVHYK